MATHEAMIYQAAEIETEAKELVDRLCPIAADADVLQVLARRLSEPGRGATRAIWQRAFVQAAISLYTVNLEIDGKGFAYHSLLAKVHAFRNKASEGRLRQLCGELLRVDGIDRYPSRFQIDTHTYDAVLDGFVARVDELCQQAEQQEAEAALPSQGKKMSTSKKETLPVYIGVYKYSSVESAMERRGVQGISAEELEYILQTNGEAFVKSGDGKIHLWNVSGGCGHKMFLGKIKAVNE